MSEILSFKSYGKTLNDLTFTDYYFRLSLLARSVFKWENLPNGINERWIEKFLFRYGKCVIYEDENKGLMVAQCTIDGDLNNYEEPTTVTPCGIDVKPESLIVGKDCVLLKNNDLMLPTSQFIKLFAYRLTDTTRTIDINVNAQKTPVLVISSDKQRLTLKNVYAQWNGNEPVIYGDKNLDIEGIKVLKTEAPIVFPQLQDHKICIWNECLTFLGINNANTEKRERLITGEVEANNGHIELSADCFLKSREDGANEINNLFGGNVSVDMRRKEEIQCKQDTPNISEI